MSDYIEAVFLVDHNGNHVYRARGVAKHTTAELAAALGVDESRITVTIDAEQFAADQRHIRREQLKTQRKTNWNVFTGKTDD